MEDWWVEAPHDFSSSNAWRYLRVTFIWYPKTIKTEVHLYIDNLAPTIKFIQGKIVNQLIYPDVRLTDCNPFFPNCLRSDTIGWKFRGTIKQVWVNHRHNCLEHITYSNGGWNGTCPDTKCSICPEINTLNWPWDTCGITCGLNSWYNSTDQTCNPCAT